MPPYMCPRCSAISTRHVSEQVDWCVATRHLTVRGYETRTHRTCVRSSTRHLSLVLGERCPQDMSCVCGKERPQTSGFATRHTCAVLSRINKTSVQKIVKIAFPHSPSGSPSNLPVTSTSAHRLCLCCGICGTRVSGTVNWQDGSVFTYKTYMLHPHPRYMDHFWGNPRRSLRGYTTYTGRHLWYRLHTVLPTPRTDRVSHSSSGLCGPARTVPFPAV